MPYNVVIYARTSPDCTVSTELQVERLKAVAAEHGWMVADLFIDRRATVKKDRRPGEIALLDAIRAGGVQKVLLWSIDRVGRSLVDLVSFLETCRAAGIGLYLHEQGLDTATSNGMCLFDLSGMMAHHLRQSRRDRILRGQAAVRDICAIWQTTHSFTQGGEGQKGLDDRKGRTRSRQIGGNFSRVSQSAN
jgi:DNA invertase Pin-like site-specific DNA recombinase